METWMIGIGINLLGLAAVFGAYRNKVNTLENNQKEIKGIVTTIFNRLDKHGDKIVTLDAVSKVAMTAKDVDDKYISKEVFRQMEKHIDSRFDDIQKGLSDIIHKLEKEH